jgi:antitoxin component of MazEF toxin-antitoxin module
MPTKLCRWGHSLGLRIPYVIAQAAGLKAGSYLEVRLLDCGEIRLRPVGHIATVDASAGKEIVVATAPRESKW